MISFLRLNVKTKVLEKLIEVKVLSLVSAFSVFLSCFFVLWVINPDGVLFKLSTPTGGDLGAHVWGPADQESSQSRQVSGGRWKVNKHSYFWNLARSLQGYSS